MSPMLKHPLAEVLAAAFNTSLANARPTYPPFNVLVATNGDTRIEVAVAGFEPEELNVATAAGQLTIEGQKAEVPETENAPEYLRRGIAARAFRLTFDVPVALAVGAVTLKNGILSVALPVQPEAQPKKLSITAA